MNKLSILIPTFSRDAHLLPDLRQELIRQAEICDQHIEFLIDSHETDCIGLKRNRLLSKATGEYVAFIDSDDKISPNYIKAILKGLKTSPDCCSLKGIITWNGKRPELFEHSLDYSEWGTNEKAKRNEIKYFRYPNHINCIKSTIAKQFMFPEKNFGEDFDWSMRLNWSNIMQNEYRINEILYYYNYRPSK